MATDEQRANIRERNRVFATVLIAAITLFLMAMAVWNTWAMSSSKWCNQVIGTEQVTGERSVNTTANCIAIFRDQINALSVYGYIGLSTLALCVIVLVIIVVARGKVSFSASKDGVTADVSKEGDG